MAILFQNVTAVLMDDAGTVLKGAFVAVEGDKILSVGAQRPEGAFDEVVDGAGKVLMPCLLYTSVKGAADILSAVEQKLGIKTGSITKDGKFSLDACRCVGACGLAPVMMVGSDVYGRLTPDQVGPILDKYE